MRLFRWLMVLVAALFVGVEPMRAATLQAAPLFDGLMSWLASPEVLIGIGALGAALASTHPTMLDLAQRLDPNDQIARIIEILAEENGVLDDMVVLEGNELTGHVTTVRTGIPEPTWRKLYGGVQPSKSTTVQIRDACGMAEAYAEVDKALADMNGNTAAFRMSENMPHLEGFKQKIARSMFYSNEASEPEAFTGFVPRFNDGNGPENAENILDGGGNDTDHTSIWLVVWGPNTVHAFYPKGSTAGLTMKDLGEVTIENVDGAGGRMQAYRTHYRWDIGLSVRDWRYVVRIANIEISDLVKDAATGADLVDLMTQALELVQDTTSGRPAFYCNRTIRSFLRRQIRNANNVQISMDEVAGKKVLTFDGVPVRRCDAITNTEDSVSFA